MIGLDTNILVRYLTQDDPEQSQRANTIMETQLSQREPGFVNVVVIAETVWVLQRRYRFSPTQIAGALSLLLQADMLVIDQEQQVFAAMIAVKEGRGSFPDALIGALDASAGCERTLTFDRGAARIRGFQLV